MPRIFSQNVASDFAAPTALPQTAEQDAAWQQANRRWWEENPMEYKWEGHQDLVPGSREFFEEIDRLFLASAATYMPPRDRPFDREIPYARLADGDVLEIGVGSGTHAALLAGACRSFTGIDLTEHATTLTRRRFEVCGLAGDIRQMDAQQLDFPDASFDFVWSWGVIHHSANTEQILREIARVLRPGGQAGIMVYHRSFWWWYVVSAFIRGVLMGQFRRTRSIHTIVQNNMDGALARFYTPGEWRDLARRCGVPCESIRVYGDKVEMVPLPPGALKNNVLRLLPDRVSRWFLNDLKQGYFLVATHTKPG